VIKTYVACGLGVGIIASMAFDPMRDLGLRKIEAGHLFGPNTTMMAFRRGQILKRYAYRFAQLCTQTLQPDDLRRQVESAPTWQG
jgi:LysR family cys regulon transcriptional activator